MMKELMNIIKNDEGFCATIKGISYVEWAKVEALGFPSVNRYYVNADDLEEIIDNAIAKIQKETHVIILIAL